VRNKGDRRRMLKRVYGDAASKPRADAPWEPWIDLDRIDGEIVALLDHDPPQAERFFLNRKLAGESAAFDAPRWRDLADEGATPEPGSLIVLGVDGARFDDALAVVATDVETGHQWPIEIIERPPNADANYEHDFDRVDGAVIEASERWDVWRIYVDPQYIDSLLDRWQGRWEKRALPWYTNRPRQIGQAVRNYTAAISAGDLSHDGDPVFERHIVNARKQKLNVYDDDRRPLHTISKDRPHSPNKMDAAMAAVVSWECRGDAIAAGATARRVSEVVFL